MQLSTIDYQIERIAALLTKYNYTDDEKAIKLSYLRGYVAACLDASVISANEYKAFVTQIEGLWYFSEAKWWCLNLWIVFIS